MTADRWTDEYAGGDEQMNMQLQVMSVHGCDVTQEIEGQNTIGN